MKKLLLILALAMLTSACKHQSNGIKTEVSNNPAQDALTLKLDSISKQGPIIGFSVAVVNLDGVIYNEGFGYADIVNNKKYTPQTLQNIGSISKTLIGISLLKAQELGKLELDDAVNTFLPFKVINKKHPETPITLRQLATHTSSILDSDYYGMSYVLIDNELAPNERSMEYFQAAETKTSMEEYLEKVVGEHGVWNTDESFADYAPGTMYEYSNIAATLATLAIEKATGSSFKEFTKKHILDPLEMNSSGWSNSDIDISQRSRLFINKDTLIAKYELITYPDGGFISSTADLSRYLIELMKGKAGKGTILNQVSYKELFAKQLTKTQLPERAQDANSGIFMDFSKRGLGHSGGDPGIVTYMYFNPETNIGKIVFENTDFEEDRAVINSFKEIWKTLDLFESTL
ncbi:serine hydrolase domain-containing protein [Ulvibacter antarcticus]|uniref:CubicO group peptidase (Beta-lactamase class C family) n=1 Tax=Ulvibacter antarcticus TaxID=442714 RepID=A0A3L9YU92_9FLAO|nr:serine hydrolase domain-containing protein [Ulvibacter antarcticus]RMA64321.1 CubicO group peptidase (beta-lactamase class C family) [Ulvibacter antarcticus]